VKLHCKFPVEWDSVRIFENRSITDEVMTKMWWPTSLFHGVLCQPLL